MLPIESGAFEGDGEIRQTEVARIVLRFQPLLVVVADTQRVIGSATMTSDFDRTKTPEGVPVNQVSGVIRLDRLGPDGQREQVGVA